MARPLRIEFAGVLCFVTARVHARHDFYVGDAYRRLFLDQLGHTATSAWDSSSKWARSAVSHTPESRAVKVAEKRE